MSGATERRDWLRCPACDKPAREPDRYDIRRGALFYETNEDFACPACGVALRVEVTSDDEDDDQDDQDDAIARLMVSG